MPKAIHTAVVTALSGSRFLGRKMRPRTTILAALCLAVSCGNSGEEHRDAPEGRPEAATKREADLCGPAVEGLSLVLKPQKGCYFEYEPLRFSLEITNTTDEERTLPPAVDDAFELAIRPAAASGPRRSGGSRTGGTEERVQPRSVGSGETLALPLPRRSGRWCCESGTFRIAYMYFGPSWKPGQEPALASGQLTVECVRQPLVFPEGTSESVVNLLKGLREAGRSGFLSQIPGWSEVDYNEPMMELAKLGDEAVPALIANLGNHRIQLQLAQLLAAMRAKEAVPSLLEQLWMEDDWHDFIVIAKLSEITGHPDGYRFHRRWYVPAVRREAVSAYRAWWKEEIALAREADFK